jgi:hypothetical protein
MKESEWGVSKIEESESEVLKIEKSESELLCTGCTALVVLAYEGIFLFGFTLCLIRRNSGF